MSAASKTVRIASGVAFSIVLVMTCGLYTHNWYFAAWTGAMIALGYRIGAE